jgi:hypothetical protein
MTARSRRRDPRRASAFGQSIYKVVGYLGPDAGLSQRLVGGEALGLVGSGSMLLRGGERGVIPIVVTPHVSHVFAPTLVVSMRS